MEISEADQDGILILEPAGRVDNTNAKQFAAEIIKVIQTRQCGVVIDFQKIRYISSAGFRSLLIIGKLMEDANRKLVLCGMAADVRSVFDFARFDEVFVICSSRQDATAQAK